jgi:hypothetical protein
MHVGSTGYYSWGTTFLNASTRLHSRAANIVSQYNGTNAQGHEVYSTRGSSVNFERLLIGGNSLTTETGGTGAADINLSFFTAGSGLIVMGPVLDQTTDPLVSGALWNNSGVINISA